LKAFEEESFKEFGHEGEETNGSIRRDSMWGFAGFGDRDHLCEFPCDREVGKPQHTVVYGGQ